MVLEDKLAKSVLDNMATRNAIYIPWNVVQSISIFLAVDNIDFDEDTPDGKHTLHGTMMVAFQNPKNMTNPHLLQDRQQRNGRSGRRPVIFLHPANTHHLWDHTPTQSELGVVSMLYRATVCFS